jgi:lysophospholipase L1-like esterase
MPLQEAVARGIEVGRSQAREHLARRSARRAAPLAFQGYLILEGDSWFDFPIYDEITEVLRDELGYSTRSAAHYGDTAQEIAYLPNQLAKLEQVFQDLAGDRHVARAILLSCGGNDVMDALSALMNARGSSSRVWHPAVVEAVLREQVPFAIAALVARALELSERYFRARRPVVIHGYANPVPDGRGFRCIATLAGPWMMPVFTRKGYVSAADQPASELRENADAMSELMTIFNDEVLPGIRDTANREYGAELVHCVDVRGELTSELARDRYEDDWRDELHPTAPGFARVARAIHDAIRRAAPALPSDLA